MTKTIRSTGLLVVVLSSLTAGCADNLPELPITPPVPIQAAPVAAPFSQADLVSKNNATNEDSNSEVTYEETKNKNTSDFPLDLIANDLVRGLSFISGINPRLTSIYAPAPGSAFDNLVKDSMLKKGYRVDGRRFQPGSQTLTTSFIETNKVQQSSDITAIMSLNSVLIKRTYSIQNDSVEPKGSYSIRGIRPELVDTSEQVRTL